MGTAWDTGVYTGRNTRLDTSLDTFAYPLTFPTDRPTLYTGLNTGLYPGRYTRQGTGRCTVPHTGQYPGRCTGQSTVVSTGAYAGRYTRQRAAQCTGSSTALRTVPCTVPLGCFSPNLGKKHGGSEGYGTHAGKYSYGPTVKTNLLYMFKMHISTTPAHPPFPAGGLHHHYTNYMKNNCFSTRTLHESGPPTPQGRPPRRAPSHEFLVHINNSHRTG